MKNTQMGAEDSPLRSYLAEISALDIAERSAIMVVKESGFRGEPEVERYIRGVFVWAALNLCSDVHIGVRSVKGGQGAEELAVFTNVRTSDGFVRDVYRGESCKHFRTKLFQITNTPDGGSTPSRISTRFSFSLPAHMARTKGLEADGEFYDISVRVEYIKTFSGFSFVCRLLDQQRAPALEDLGLSHSLLRAVKRSAEEPSGLILITGPTGSGKTTFLNGVLDYLNDGSRSIKTLENPVEYELKGDGPVEQIPVGGDITFANGLRSILRQDPDVILVGEIRDEETMEIALKASQTGHMVLATLHANSAGETITRARDLLKNTSNGSYDLAEVLRMVLAVRLVTRYEGERRERSLTPDEQEWLKINGMGHMTALTEVKPERKIGKAAVIEAIVIDAPLKKIIRGEQLDMTAVYQSASKQLQYEPLAAAGVRMIAERGANLKNCRVILESNPEAEHAPCLRILRSKEQGVGLDVIAHQIDAELLLRDTEENPC